jgi:hypothetical protein
MAEMRQRVKDATGTDIFAVALIFRIAEAGPVALQIGFDALSTYANPPGADDRPVPYARCAELARQFWARGRRLQANFLPTVTLGWDYRPILDSPELSVSRDPKGSWCEPASDADWATQIRLAVETAADSINEAFPSVIIYAWNEFAEGGWLAPTVGEGVRRLSAVSTALGRARADGRVELRWPARIDSSSCDVRSVPRTLRHAGPNCAVERDEMTADWPCPPTMTAVQDELRMPSGTEALWHGGPWQIRTCAEERN